MAKSNQLRKNTNQHAPKNTESKISDKEIYAAMQDCIQYLKNRFPQELTQYDLSFQNYLSFEQIIAVIKSSGLRREFDSVFNTRRIIPDGGVIFLKKIDCSEPAKIVLVSEVKKQGTNESRIREGKKKQAQGNAIERLGKNLTGIKAMMNHERITPFVCFGWGCDFVENYDNTDDNFVMAKISMMNEFYKINKIHVYKRDGDSNRNSFAPVSMYFREREWRRQEMFEILKEVGEDAIRYYLH